MPVLLASASTGLAVWLALQLKGIGLILAAVGIGGAAYVVIRFFQEITARQRLQIISSKKGPKTTHGKSTEMMNVGPPMQRPR
jgi:hypothetical protein